MKAYEKMITNVSLKYVFYDHTCNIQRDGPFGHKSSGQGLVASLIVLVNSCISINLLLVFPQKQ